MSIQESLRIVPRGEIALLEWDLYGEKVNKLGTPIMTRFAELLSELAEGPFKAVVVISRKKKVFIAGADIDEIKSIKKHDEFVQAVRAGQTIINQLEDLGLLTIAAIHGACLGGGCELALACDYRIASDDRSTRIGLPETKLGLIPGFGGCVRLPRVVGLQNALDIILGGKAVGAHKACKMGLVDKVVAEALLEDQAIKMARDLIRKKAGKRRKKFAPRSLSQRFLESFAGRPLVFSTAQKQVKKITHGHYPAPLKALEVMQKTYGMANRELALAHEAMGFAEVATSEVSRYLIDLFFMMESVKKNTGVTDPQVRPKTVQSMAVLGAGTMGGGIAQVAADNGVKVWMKDLQQSALQAGFTAAQKVWDKELKKYRINKYDYEQKMERIQGTTTYENFSDLDFVVEAIVEDMEIKKKVLAEVAGHVQDDCILATNTSSLSVTEMADALSRPENFVGMHFFNPVNKMPLVEVIRGVKTSDVAVATVYDLAKKMGKIPIVVKDGPGFLVNRLLLPYLAEAAFLLAEGMAIEVVDKMYVQEFGMPMGPFHLMDEIGIDVCLKVLKIFRKALGPRVEVAPVMEKLEASGRLGKKNHKGFYVYDEKGKKQGVDPQLYAELGLSTPSNPLSNKECLQRGVFLMVNEAALVLHEERVVENARDLDLAMIMGTGFPPFRGGLLRYADSLGSEYVVNELELYANQYGMRFKPCTPLSNMAKTKRLFYH